jgi:Xaa-Pro aminopeptidase
MLSPSLITEYRKVQGIAKEVHSLLAANIFESDTERSIAAKAHQALADRGCSETWYYDCPAFVLLGARSCLSISGRDYVPGLEPIGKTNLVTVDLSPVLNGCWGDCARSFFIERGCVALLPDLPEFRVGKLFLDALHTDVMSFVNSDTTFHQLFDWTNNRILSAGFENLDFAKNVGHSIATRREDRQYVMAGNHKRLADAPFFTFEPHVRVAGQTWGFKHENILFFNANGTLEVRGGFGFSDRGVSGVLPGQYSNRRADIHEKAKT